MPPPRTIADVTRFIDESEAVEDSTTSELLNIANRAPPATDDDVELWRFYRDRGHAARMIGAAGQAVEDLELSLQHVRKSGRNDENYLGVHPRGVLLSLSWLHVRLGNYNVAIKFAKEGARLVPSEQVGQFIGIYTSLGLQLAGIGDFDGADAAIRLAKGVLPEIDFWTSGREWIPVTRAEFLNSKGEVMLLRGQFGEAEVVLGDALAILQHDIENVDLETKGGPAEGGSLDEWRHRLKAFVETNLAIVLIKQDRLVEAETFIRSALRTLLSRFGRRSADSLASLSTLARVLIEQGRFAEAEQLAQIVISTFEDLGAGAKSLSLAESRNVLIDALIGQARWAEAISQVELIERAFADDTETFARLFARDPNRALVMLLAGRDDAALTAAMATAEATRAALGDKHYESAEARGILAMVYSARGETTAALRIFSTSLPILLQRSRIADSERSSATTRRTRVKLILEAYLSLLAARAEATKHTDHVEEAFAIAQEINKRAVERALRANSARAMAGNPELVDLVRSEQDTRLRIGALYDVLSNQLSTAASQQDKVIINDLRIRIDNLRGARATLAEEIERRFPDYAQLIHSRGVSIESARAALDAGEALIVTSLGSEKSYAWAIPKAGEVAFAVVPLGRDRMAAAVAQLRAALDPQAETLGDIPDFDLTTAYKIYEAMLLPVRAGWQDAQSLLVVADDALGQLPFSLLPTRRENRAGTTDLLFEQYKTVPWLARTHAVTVLPSVASLTTLRSLPPASQERRAFAGFGDPVFNRNQVTAANDIASSVLAKRGQLATRGLPLQLRSSPRTEGVTSADLSLLPRLPDTADEIRSIARALSADLTRDVFLGKAANEKTVKTLDLAQYRVLAFATHGLVPGDLNGLTQPALALSAPEVAEVEGDGLLALGEILSLKLDADWVVLSACNTGTGDGAGAEAVSGLGRAFFYAGARSLLVSNWPVETNSAKALTTETFRLQGLAGSPGRAEALRQSMMTLMDGAGFVDAEGKSVFSYAHPIFWAPFSIVGDGGGNRPIN